MRKHGGVRIAKQKNSNQLLKSSHKKFLFSLLIIAAVAISVISALLVIKAKNQQYTQYNHNLPITATPMNVQLQGYNLGVIPINQDIKNGYFIAIPNTKLEIKVPASFKQRKNEKQDSFIPVTPIFTARNDLAQLNRDYSDCYNNGWKYLRSDSAGYISEIYCNKLLASTNLPAILHDPNPYNHAAAITPDFAIAEVVTTSSPQDWILDNFHPQGVDIRKDPTWQPQSKILTLYGNTFFAYAIGCCAWGEPVYFYPYPSIQNIQRLIVFIGGGDRNIDDPYLDAIVETLQEKR